MVWLLLLLGLLILIIFVGKSPGVAGPRRKRGDDHAGGGSGVVMLDGAPIIEPNDNGFSLGDGFVQYDTDDDARFRPGSGSGGGAGASGSWDDDGGGGD